MAVGVDGDRNFDLVVLGGGTGGYAAAFRARELGLSAAIVEREKLGGTCLHRGCIPAKSLLHSAEMLETVRRAPRFGILVGQPEVVWEDVQRAKADVVERIYKGLGALASARGVEIIAGTGSLGSDDTVSISTAGGSKRIGYKDAVLATGSRPRVVPDIQIGGPIITSNEALNLPDIPKSVVILGGGYVGVEFASMWRSFGSDVTIVEMAPRLMLQEDADISTALTKALEERGIKILLGAVLKSADATAAGVKAEVERSGQYIDIKADKLLVAVGREPVSDGLAAAGIETEKGYVKVDEALMTSRRGVYAVGDLIPTPQLAHVAFAEGMYVSEKIGGLDPPPIDYDAVPHCVYSHPEVAAVGLTEEEARARGHEVTVVREPFKINSRAVISGELDGQVKVVSRAGGGILGVHMIGPNVTELVSEAMLLTGWEVEAEDMAGFFHPHPTFSEAIGEAALKLAGKPLHSL